jgi:hypothetical protein
MFFDAAERSLKYAQETSKTVAQAQAAVEDCDKRLTELAEQDQDHQGAEHFDEYESHCIRLESLGVHVSAKYAPMLQALATVQILAASSVEAFINDTAKPRLSGKEWDAFEQCSLEAKWILFARMLSCTSLVSGREPLQGLSRLVKRRNALVHYKPKREPWTMAGTPTFLESLGLTAEAGEDAIRSVRSLVITLNAELGLAPPLWLQIEGRLGYFDTDYGKEGTHLSQCFVLDQR